MNNEGVTVLVPTSPMPSHPDTYIIEKTLNAIRFHFPNSPIVIMADGIWEKLEHRRAQYEAYLENLQKLIGAGTWGTQVHLTRFNKHTQQAGMTRAVLEAGLVRTPLVFFNEHDAPMRIDRDIDWNTFRGLLLSGQANLIRLSYFEEGIHPAHTHLARGQDVINGARYVHTVQYSQWPHMASVAFYHRILRDHFPLGIVQMIELGMYGPVVGAPWENYRVMVYCPDGPAQRFSHMNGRAGDPCDWS